MIFKALAKEKGGINNEKRSLFAAGSIVFN